MPTVTVSPKFQVVIPKEVRERCDLKSGTKVEVIELDGRIELVPVPEIKELRGMLKGRENTFTREADRCLS